MPVEERYAFASSQMGYCSLARAHTQVGSDYTCSMIGGTLVKESTMEAKNGRFGNGQTDCKACGAKLSKLRELKLEISHKQTGAPLSSLWYAVPLCEKCAAGSPVSVDLSWEADTIDVGNIMG